MYARNIAGFARQIFPALAGFAADNPRAHRIARQHRGLNRRRGNQQGRGCADDMRCCKIIAEFGKAQISQIAIMATIAPRPFSRNIEHGKLLTVHECTDWHGLRIGLFVDFGNGGDAGTQHRHGIMRRKQFSSEFDVGQIAANRRRALVTDEAMARQRVGWPFA